MAQDCFRAVQICSIAKLSRRFSSLENNVFTEASIRHALRRESVRKDCGYMSASTLVRIVTGVPHTEFFRLKIQSINLRHFRFENPTLGDEQEEY